MFTPIDYPFAMEQHHNQLRNAERKRLVRQMQAGKGVTMANKSNQVMTIFQLLMNSTTNRTNPWRRAFYATVALALLLFGLWGTWQPAHADSLNVSCQPQALSSAILIANGNNTIDTLTLTPNCIYEFAAEHSNDNALPTITNRLTIEGNNATIRRAQNTAPFRLLLIAPDADDTPIILRKLKQMGLVYDAHKR